jgi:asparagine synthase (glutamine-hydrolysing)
MFAFVLYDKNLDRYIASRDPIGIIPLYQGTAADGSVWFASEMKALFEDCIGTVRAFEPGCLYDSRNGNSERWFKPQWWDERWVPKPSAQFSALNKPKIDQEIMQQLAGKVPVDEQTLRRVREALERAVYKQLMTEVPFGVLLSGGLDSSLIAAIAARFTAKAAHDSLDAEPSEVSPTTPTPGALWSPRLHSFSIGLPGSPDLVAARRVAKYLQTIHHEYTFTVQEGLDAVHDVIYHLETYDVTTVRASTPMYLMSRKIKATGVKMVLSGEGSDEVFGGFLCSFSSF